MTPIRGTYTDQHRIPTPQGKVSRPPRTGDADVITGDEVFRLVQRAARTAATTGQRAPQPFEVLELLAPQARRCSRQAHSNRPLVNHPNSVVPTFSDPRPRAPHDGCCFGCVDSEPRLPGKLGDPFALSRWRFEQF